VRSRLLFAVFLGFAAAVAGWNAATSAHAGLGGARFQSVEITELDTDAGPFTQVKILLTYPGEEGAANDRPMSPLPGEHARAETLRQRATQWYREQYRKKWEGQLPAAFFDASEKFGDSIRNPSEMVILFHGRDMQRIAGVLEYTHVDNRNRRLPVEIMKGAQIASQKPVWGRFTYMFNAGHDQGDEPTSPATYRMGLKLGLTSEINKLAIDESSPYRGVLSQFLFYASTASGTRLADRGRLLPYNSRIEAEFGGSRAARRKRGIRGTRLWNQERKQGHVHVQTSSHLIRCHPLLTEYYKSMGFNLRERITHEGFDYDVLELSRDALVHLITEKLVNKPGAQIFMRAKRHEVLRDLAPKSGNKARH
jgi:hypothetical protein